MNTLSRFINRIDPWGLASIVSMILSALFMAFLVMAAITFAEARFQARVCALCSTDTECAIACGGDGSPE